MTDRELLELAAKAAGWESWDWLEDDALNVYAKDGRHDVFEPLSDDGDALRLAVQLRLMIAWDRWNGNDYVCIRHRDLDEELAIQIDQKRREQTVRRAIVMAAAEIGREM